MLMNYLEWCEYVLDVYLEGARNSLEVRRDDLRPEQVAQRVFGPEFVRQAEFGESVQYMALRQAIRDLAQQELLYTRDDLVFGDEPKTPGTITNEGKAYLKDEQAKWAEWSKICSNASDFTTEQRELLELVNSMSPQQEGSYAWLDWVHEESLRPELGWDAEMLRVVIQEIRFPYDYDYVLTRPFFNPGETITSDGLGVRTTYQGIVLQTKRHLTVEAREIDKLVVEWETTSVDFKRELKIDTKDQKAEFVKDVLGLANTQASSERWLIVGFDDKSRAYHSPPDPNLKQERLEQILAVYVDPQLDIRYDMVEHYQGFVGKVQVVRDPTKLPYKVAKSVGDRKRVEKGQIFVRHGSLTEEPTPGELQAIRAEGERARRAQAS